MVGSGVDPGFVEPEADTIFVALCKKKEYYIMNSELGTKVNIYFKWEKKSQQITNLKKLADITNITKSRKIT